MSTSAPMGFFPGKVISGKAAQDWLTAGYRYRFVRDNTIAGEYFIASDPTTYPMAGIGGIYNTPPLGAALDVVVSGTALLSIADSSLGVGARVKPNSVGQGTVAAFGDVTALVWATIKYPVTAAGMVVEVNLV